jgi:hypothetical protein
MNLFARKKKPKAKTLTGILLGASVNQVESTNDLSFDDLNDFYDEVVAKLNSPERTLAGTSTYSEIGNGMHRIVDERTPYHGHSCLRSFRGVHFQNHADVYVYLTEDDAGFGGAEMYCGVFITNKQDGHSQNEHNRTRQKEKLLEQFPILAKFDESGPEITQEMLKEVNRDDKERLKLLGPCFDYIR